MASIFISYRRRSESSGYAQAIADRLKKHFGENQLFRDIDNIESGSDFVDVISSAVGRCKVLLAVIGPDWLSAKDSSGQRRLDDPSDFLRIEVSSALERGIRVIPVLVGGATMPSQDELPDDLKALARRQAHEFSEKRWDYDIQQLVAVLERAGVTGPHRQEQRGGERRHRKWAAAAAIVAIVVVGAVISKPVWEGIIGRNGSDGEIRQGQAPGALLVESHPPGAAVFLDGREQGTTADGRLRIPNLVPNTYRLRVERDGFLAWEAAVEVEAVIDLLVVAELEPSGGELGALLIESRPPDGMVFLNEKKMGVAQEGGLRLPNLKPGDYRVVVVRDGFSPWEGEVRIEPGEPSRVLATLEREADASPTVGQLIDQYAELAEALAPVRERAWEAMLEREGDTAELREAFEYYSYVEKSMMRRRDLDFNRDPRLEGPLRELLRRQALYMERLAPDRADEIRRMVELHHRLLLPEEY